MLTFTCFFQGGLKAVIWTDVFQFAVMFTGIFAVIIKVIVPIDCTYIKDVYSYKVFFLKIQQIGKTFIKTSLETLLLIPCFIRVQFMLVASAKPGTLQTKMDDLIGLSKHNMFIDSSNARR